MNGLAIEEFARTYIKGLPLEEQLAIALFIAKMKSAWLAERAKETTTDEVIGKGETP